MCCSNRTIAIFLWVLLAMILNACQIAPLPAVEPVLHPAAAKDKARDQAALQAFEQEIEQLRQELNIPGLSVAVLHEQEIMWARGFGLADVEAERPASEHTPYYIASLTKPFTSALIMQLVEAGQLDLDAEMAGILKDVLFTFPPPGDSLGPIPGYAKLCAGLIELGQATSGPFAPYAFLFRNYHCDTEPITVRHHLTHTAQGVPGEAYWYNGFLYGLLLWVVEDASGERFVDLLVEKIIGPLEMTSTYPNPSDSRGRQILAEMARPYHIDDAGQAVLSEDPGDDVGAAAGMASTVLDLAKFDAAMDRNLIVTEPSKQTMFSPALSNSGQTLPYGLGWFVQEHRGQRLIWHYGWETNAYSSLILKAPEQEWTLILLANSDGASAGFNLGAGDVRRSPFAATFLELFVR